MKHTSLNKLLGTEEVKNIRLGTVGETRSKTLFLSLSVYYSKILKAECEVTRQHMLTYQITNLNK